MADVIINLSGIVDNERDNGDGTGAIILKNSDDSFIWVDLNKAFWKQYKKKKDKEIIVSGQALPKKTIKNTPFLFLKCANMR